MNRIFRPTEIARVLSVITALVLCVVACASEVPREGGESGTLVIAGGAVRADNQAIFRAFLDAMSDSTSGNIAIISAASGEPMKSATSFSDTLRTYGVAEERISLVRLAVRDDETTADVDESQWSVNARDATEIKKIVQADAIWFAGGDQSRLTAVLYDKTGQPTPMLEAIRERLSAGAALGGTSAGAAIMSDPMITGGDPMAALLENGRAGEPLTMNRGLGFFPFGLVDQHFDARARLGRVAVAVSQFPPERRIAFGVDENTALVYRFDDTTVSVVGAGNVTIVDARRAIWSRVDNRIGIDGLVLSVLSPGDRLTMRTGEFRPASYSKPTVGNEYHDFEPNAGGGMAVPTGRLSRMLGEQLLDNSGSTKIESYSFNISETSKEAQSNADKANADGVLYRFVQTPDSVGYWGYNSDGASRYTIMNVEFAISPFSATIHPILKRPAESATE